MLQKVIVILVLSMFGIASAQTPQTGKFSRMNLSFYEDIMRYHYCITNFAQLNSALYLALYLITCIICQMPLNLI